jgi:hypothetical protein
MGSIPVIMHPGGVDSADQTHYGQAPVQSVAGLSMCRDPLAGSFVAMCSLPGMQTIGGAPKFGYITLLKKGQTDTRANKVRLITTDHPDAS